MGKSLNFSGPQFPHLQNGEWPASSGLHCAIVVIIYKHYLSWILDQMKQTLVLGRLNLSSYWPSWKNMSTCLFCPFLQEATLVCFLPSGQGLTYFRPQSWPKNISLLFCSWPLSNWLYPQRQKVQLKVGSCRPSPTSITLLLTCPSFITFVYLTGILWKHCWILCCM
jgi:hypothetical protein